jgi:hypothetical protein
MFAQERYVADMDPRKQVIAVLSNYNSITYSVKQTGQIYDHECQPHNTI